MLLTLGRSNCTRIMDTTRGARENSSLCEYCVTARRSPGTRQASTAWCEEPRHLVSVAALSVQFTKP